MICDENLKLPNNWLPISKPNQILILITKTFYSIVKMFAQNKDDRKRVKNALDAAGTPSAKVTLDA